MNFAWGNRRIDFGDNVRVLSTAATVERGLAGLIGQVFGQTTPSVTNVEVIGELVEDYAVNVHFKSTGKAFWLTEQLLEFVDHAPGTVISIGSRKLKRSTDGKWVEESPSVNSPGKPWWRFW